jgi:hypothetical protein
MLPPCCKDDICFRSSRKKSFPFAIVFAASVSNNGPRRRKEEDVNIRFDPQGPLERELAASLLVGLYTADLGSGKGFLSACQYLN